MSPWLKSLFKYERNEMRTQILVFLALVGFMNFAQAEFSPSDHDGITRPKEEKKVKLYFDQNIHLIQTMSVQKTITSLR